jgi:antitoxin component of MazEF toxin-antitoxin module
MDNKRTLQKQGGSLVVAIPPYIIYHLNLSKGDKVTMELVDRRDGSKPFIKVSKEGELSIEK